MATIHLMVPGFTVLGQLPTPSQTGICALTGPNQVINFLVSLYHGLRPILFPGYDQLIQERIHYMLDTSVRFRKQMDFFLANDDGEVEIEEGMSYLSLVVLLPSFSA